MTSRVDYAPHECPYRDKHRGDISQCAWCQFDPLYDDPRVLTTDSVRADIALSTDSPTEDKPDDSTN